MHDFLLKELHTNNIENELIKIGFDKSYTGPASLKFQYKNFKFFDLTVAQANILKQTALSVGADCATHKEVITGKQEISSCILGGSISQLKKISKKLACQPFDLKLLAQQIEIKLTTIKNDKTRIIGILNLTPDSFSDGGEFVDLEAAIKHLHRLIEDGADIIDIGAESTKPNSKPVSSATQLEKLIPVLNYIKEQNIQIPISIDTRSAEVAQRCIELGASIINDVSGFDYDPKMPEVIAKSGAKIILQHSKGTPETMQNSPTYKNLMDEIYVSLKQKVDFAQSKGIKLENIILDAGIGFGKTREHNFEILNRWPELKTIGCPILLGISRKSLLNLPANSTNEEKDIYTLALNSKLIQEDIDYIRVHNVKYHKTLLDILKS